MIQSYQNKNQFKSHVQFYLGHELGNKKRAQKKKTMTFFKFCEKLDDIEA